MSLHSLSNNVLKRFFPRVYSHINEVHADRHPLCQALIEFQEAIVNNISPRTLYRELSIIIKKYGLRIGIIVAVLEILDHFGLPFLLLYFKCYKLAALVTVLPITEIFVYPAVIFFIAKRKTLTNS
jgi:hypothetical protein